MKFTKDDIQRIFHDTGIILGITLIAGLLLGFVYQLTKNPIEEQEIKAQADACAEVFKEVDENGELAAVVDLSFAEVDVKDWAVAKLEEEGYTGAVIDTVYEAKTADGNLYGYVLSVTSSEGYGGKINFYMGITTEPMLKGISILSISETPGLGMNAPKVLVPQFRNKKLEDFVVVKSGAISSNEIDAITSATITSNAVTGGVNTGVRYYQILQEGGAQ